MLPTFTPKALNNLEPIIYSPGIEQLVERLGEMLMLMIPLTLWNCLRK
jgi:hypothetical protein